MKSHIATLINKSSRLTGQHVAAARLSDLEHQLDKLGSGLDASVLFAEAWRIAGLEGTPARLDHPQLSDLPFTIYSDAKGWGIIQIRSADGTWRGESANNEALSLASLDDAACISLPRRAAAQKTPPKTLALVQSALWARKGVFIDAVLATALTTLLALATSLYAMQVFDRVIPNQGFDTLWVLTVGVIVSICFELLLKQVRSYTVDRACNAVDRDLSEWFFNRMLGIRMEARPAFVGTLASQIKGFEMVRSVLASTSLFVLAEIPFALFFIAIIFLVGGSVVAVPIITMPIALAAGLIFQRAIQNQTRKNLAASNRKAGLLVEAVDGAEALKANSAEWSVQSRWNLLVSEATSAEHSTRNFLSLSQNFTVGFQQFGYVALMATGAYFVTINELTMGGLLACSIIGNRAMMPIVQLPGVMAQWALARAAIEGLDQVISLPNENDEAHQNIVLQSIDGSLCFERARFTYGMTSRMALEVDRLDIRPGERVGMIGAIGSGKSTLLKLASGLYRPAEGKVFLGGIDLGLLAPSIVREIVGYLPQEVRLFSGTLRDNLLLGLPNPGEEAILAAAKRTGLIDLIVGQPKGLALEITEGGRGVSGGQKQIIALTRMLLARPKVWLLDEPTGAMDSATEMRIVNLLKEVASEGATLLITTHKTALLPILDRLIVLHNGRLLLDGPRDAVMAKLAGRSEPAPQNKPAS